MPLLLDLFFTFAKIGLFTFGGGYAMLSLIEHACVEEKKWIILINQGGFYYKHQPDPSCYTGGIPGL